MIKNLRSRLLVFLTHQMALPLLKMVRKPVKFNFRMADLMNLPPGTVGNDLFHFLTIRQLELLPHYAKHDIKHLLLEYDTTDEGEVCLQCCMLGNRHFSFPVIVTILYGFCTMPEYWSLFRKAFQRGKKMAAIESIAWEEIMLSKTSEVKNRIHLRNNQL
jgi:hypothetical protein